MCEEYKCAESVCIANLRGWTAIAWPLGVTYYIKCNLSIHQLHQHRFHLRLTNKQGCYGRTRVTLLPTMKDTNLSSLWDNHSCSMNSEERVGRLVTGSGGVVPAIRTADPVNLMHDVMLMNIALLSRVAGLKMVESLKTHFMDTSMQSYIQTHGDPRMCMLCQPLPEV